MNIDKIFSTTHLKVWIIVGLFLVLPFGTMIFSSYGTNVGAWSSLNSSTNTASVNYNQSLILPNFVVQRIVQARIYQVNAWTLKNENATTVGNALAALDPSYVAGLIRIASDETLKPQQIQDYNTIRSIVLKTNPNTEFDVFLTANQYNTSQQIVAKMQYINSQINVNIFFFDFYYQVYHNAPQVIDAAISYAHSQGQYVGGNVWGSGVPPGSDFAATNDVNFTVSRSLISKLETKYNIPILLDLNNNPQNNGTVGPGGNYGPWAESCYFQEVWNENQRISFISSLAKNQSSWGYHWMYPIYFPNCPTNLSYDSLRDDSLGTSAYSYMSSLLSKYDPTNTTSTSTTTDSSTTLSTSMSSTSSTSSSTISTLTRSSSESVSNVNTSKSSSALTPEANTSKEISTEMTSKATTNSVSSRALTLGTITSIAILGAGTGPLLVLPRRRNSR